MTTTTVYLVRHGKAAPQGGQYADRDRPLVAAGWKQAERLAAALAAEGVALVAASPWLRCRQTAEPLARTAGLEVVADPRLGYDETDVAGWVTEAVTAHPGAAVVAIGHADLLPEFLYDNGLLAGMPGLRTGSLFRVPVADGQLGPVSYVDRAELRKLAEEG
jgi:phosphohistidine phosphatase SixA